ncbi:AraC family transcriptional regulator [Chryseobacterium sp. A301]
MRGNKTPEKYTIDTIRGSASDFDGFNIYEFETFLKDAEHLSKSHRHNFYTFIFTLKGHGSHVIDFEEYELNAGRLFFINYDQIHSWNIQGDLKGYVILFSRSFYNLIYTGNESIKSDSALDNLPSYIDVAPEEMGSWTVLFESIYYEFLKGQEFSNEIICLFLKACVLKIQQSPEQSNYRNNKTDHKSALVQEFVLLVGQHFRELKLTKDYAKLLSITPNYLNAVVKEVLGKAAGTLIKNRTVLEAKRLLAHSNLSVRQVSLELGFSDNSHFGKYFRNEVGSTPVEFRNHSKVN